MKILGGLWKGIPLKPPKRTLSRPTQARVKKSLFDILGESIRGSQVLDLFSGSGSLGIEALSRGAKEATFVEYNPLCMKVLKENLKKLPGRTLGLCLEENAFKVIGKLYREKRRFDVVFMDPPYLEGVTTKCLRVLSKYDILNPNAILAVRHARKETLPEQMGPLAMLRQKRYGETLITFYKMKG